MSFVLMRHDFTLLKLTTQCCIPVSERRRAFILTTDSQTFDKIAAGTLDTVDTAFPRAAAVAIAGKPQPSFPRDYLPPHDSAYELHQAIIKSGKKGSAEANFWFHGKTFEGNVRVLYLLKLFGNFEPDKNWPGAQTLDMTTWELKVENEGKTIKNISRQSAGTVSVTITVE